MIRNLEVLGLALAAMFAFSALAASGAMAQGTLTSDGPVTLTGTETGGVEANQLETFGNKVRCPGSTYTGHKTLTFEQTKTQKHELLPNGATEVTLTPHNVNCVTVTALGNFPMTIDMNGCDYEFTLQGTNTLHAEDTYNLHTTIKCPAGQHIKMTTFASAAKHTANEPFCVVTIEEKATGYTGLVARDTTNGHIDITGTVNGIKASRTSPTGSFLCSNSTIENGVLKQDVTVAGHNAAGLPTNIGIHHAG